MKSFGEYRNLAEAEQVDEKSKGLWANIHAKRKRGERPAKPGEEGYPKTLDIDEASYQNKTTGEIVNTDKPQKPAPVAAPALAKKPSSLERVRAGMKSRAMKEETLDELSKSTLASYVGKAAGSAAMTAHAAGSVSQQYAGKPISTRPDDYDKSRKDTVKRLRNINKAVGKLAEEEVEDLEELNKDTLTSYQDKADMDITRKHRVLGPQIKAGDAKAANKTSDTIQKRMTGIDRAVTRLNKEETMSEFNVMGGYMSQIAKDVGSDLQESQQANTTMKHIKDPTPGEKKAAKDIKPGVAGYRDRVAMLKSAEAGGRLKEEEELEEAKPHTVPKTDKEKDLAKMAPPHDKITHADVLTGRGVKKEEMSSKEKMKRGLYNKEEAELQEAMLSYSDFQEKIAMHKKAGNEIKDDKYTDKKASYTVIDKEGVGKKMTHTASGTSQEHLGNMKREDDEDDKEVKQSGKRGRPAGSKSGARH